MLEIELGWGDRGGEEGSAFESSIVMKGSMHYMMMPSREYLGSRGLGYENIGSKRSIGLKFKVGGMNIGIEDWLLEQT